MIYKLLTFLLLLLLSQIEHYEHKLYKGDKIIWLRFWMSFLINGIGMLMKLYNTLVDLFLFLTSSTVLLCTGYHVLVHALPIMVAAQGTFTGVVARAVGMLYIVDLDDTTEVHEMTIVPLGPDTDVTDDEHEEFEKFHESLTKVDNSLDREAEMIIQEAAAKLEALAASRGVSFASNGDHGKTSTKDPSAEAMMSLMAEETRDYRGKGNKDDDDNND